MSTSEALATDAELTAQHGQHGAWRGPASFQREMALAKIAKSDGADAALIAASMVAIWQDINAALSPIIGQQGVAALFARSVLLTSAEYPWLMHAYQANPTTPDLALLQVVLQQQSRESAVAGGGALLHTYYALLDSLMGAALAERLLRSVGANP